MGSVPPWLQNQGPFTFSTFQRALSHGPRLAEEVHLRNQMRVPVTLPVHLLRLPDWHRVRSVLYGLLHNLLLAADGEVVSAYLPRLSQPRQGMARRPWLLGSADLWERPRER